MSDIDAVFAAARADPGDALAIEALADALEELGANAASVRALAVDGPTVLVFQCPPGANVEPIRTAGATVVDFLTEHTGHPVLCIIATNDISIRAIRGRMKESRP